MCLPVIEVPARRVGGACAPQTTTKMRTSALLPHLPRSRALRILLVACLLGGAIGPCLAQPDPAIPPPAPAPDTAPAPAPAPAPETNATNAVAAPATNAPPAPALKANPDPTQAVSKANSGDKTLYGFQADKVELNKALAMFARANNLNIVPDLDIRGEVTVDVRDLPLDQVMAALLEAHDYTWESSNGLIRVHSTASRTFSIDYLRLSRKGSGTSSATLSSSAGGGGSSGGTSGGATGGMSGGGAAGVGGQGGAGGSGVSGSMVNLSQDNPVDFWKELEEELIKVLSEKGKTGLAINRTAGLIQVTDRPSGLKRVEQYLASLSSTVQRQVEIEVKIYDVTLGDQFQFGVDWEQIAKAYAGQFNFIGSPTVVSPVGGAQVKPSAITMLFQNDNTSVMLTALKEQGEVHVVSQPRLRTLNNQTALIKVGTDTPFFSQNVFFVPSTTPGGAATLVNQDQYQLITIGTILSITPQVASDGFITLDISPVITSLVDTKIGPNQTTAPVIDIKQASTLVRVKGGETVVLGGLIQTATSKTTRKIPLAGDIPLLGKLFQGKFNAAQKKELVIFVTPTVIVEP
jgi:MSHA biogenesis protein MshL